MNARKPLKSIMDFELAIDFGAAHAVEHAAQVDVVPAAMLRVEAQPELEDRGDAPRHLHRAGGRVEDAGDDLEQSALARPVRADDAEHPTSLNLEAHIVERAERAVPLLAGQDFEGEIDRPLVYLEVLGDVPDPDRDVRHRAILKRRSPDGRAAG